MIVNVDARDTAVFAGKADQTVTGVTSRFWQRPCNGDKFWCIYCENWQLNSQCGLCADLGCIGDLFCSSNRLFHVMRLKKGSDQQPDSGDSKHDCCDKESFRKEGK